MEKNTKQAACVPKGLLQSEELYKESLSIDVSRESSETGLPIIKKVEVDLKINLMESRALPALDQLLKDEKIHFFSKNTNENESSFDYAFVDADKDNYRNYRETLMTLFKVGGIVIYDNTLWGGTVAMAEEQVPEILRSTRQPNWNLDKLFASSGPIR
ncbi:putative caffeoyl-CoA O-methyltransferase [Citrus sinensis]|uniref:Caffeoyl-CoA O-methyltransferase n=1 Tax=Citrus sinensis TaxID=2711 RepID=A0ACB8NV21_CITSI|nr:putative caffeoyl-CoA O-methyltransferase [Citrus sinensis]